MRSIRARLIGGYLLVVAITLLVALMLGRWLLDRNIVVGIDLLNQSEFQEIHDRAGASAKLEMEAVFLRTVKEHAGLDDPLYYFQIRNGQGKVLFRSDNMGKAVFEPNPAGVQNCSCVVPRLGTVRISQFSEGPYQVQIGSSLANHNRLFTAYSKVAVVLMATALVLSLFFGYWLSRLALDPIRKIQQTASRITADNLSERIPVGVEGDEVADLTKLLNQMFDRLEYSFGRLMRFSADASHELKTPLSLVRLQSEKLLLNDNLTPGQQDALHQQLESIGRLHSVIEKLLFISKSEFGAVRLNLRSQNTRELINAFAEDAVVLCEDAEIRFEVDSNDPISATFDSVLLRQVLLNLVNNALHVSQPGAAIRLFSSRDNTHWRVVIEDAGPGMPQEKLLEVFEPFVRLERNGEHRPGNGSGNGNGTVAGTGLGLAICRSIIELHKGRIYAQNRTGGAGLKVTFELPL